MNGYLRVSGPSLLAIASLLLLCWPTTILGRENDPCHIFPNNTQIRDPDDCSRGLTCINFKSVVTTQCSGTKAFFDKDKKECVKQLSDHSLCDISCVNATGTFVPDPKSCYGYYYCQDENWARHGTCPESYHFDSATKSCIYSHVSNCTVNTLDFCAIVADSVNFNDPSSCEKYFTCKKGKLSSASCSKQYFDPVTGECVQKSKVACSQHPIPSKVCDKKSNVYVSDQATCRGYFYCRAMDSGYDTNPTWSQCPEHLFFSEKDQACVKPLDAYCSEDRCVGRNLTFVTSSTKGCRHYLFCANGVSQGEFTCGNNFFDEEAQICTNRIIQYPACS
ncbi:peritrophin-44 [Musca vetustissima]|uniref:peritrophin-44 n=1 Tax=Musca vetustissima TaxID=27455 RepID=UPI002AB709A7|nr:peritrophin-44 [Musca vetustissima]